MASGKALFRASARGARRSGYSLSRAGRAIQRDLLDEFGYHVAPESLRVTRGFAPHASGRLERGLQARIRSYAGRIVITIFSTARSDEGFDYLAVTRHGQRMPIIRPRRAKALRFIPSGAPAGRPIFRAFVRAYRPTRDWVEEAYKALDRTMAEAQERIGRRIESRLLE